MSKGRWRLALLGALFLAAPAWALEFRAVETPAAILYDAPSGKGKKLFILRRSTPLEVVVKLDGWFKVRDADGTLGWVEARALTERRQLQVTVPKADILREANAIAPVVFSVEKGVALELQEAAPVGWAKVRHRDGSVGYVKATQVWGL